MIKPGIYKLKKHIKNSARSRGIRSWTGCKYIPPKEDSEWLTCDPDDFLFVVQDVPILGRTYREIINANAEWGSGYFIGDLPKAQDFPHASKEDLEEEVYGALQHRAEVPAPKDFLEALVPAEGKSLEELLLLYSRYKGIDPGHRLDKHRWPSLAFEVLSIWCRQSEMLEKFEDSLRHILIKDAHRTLDVVYEDPEEQEKENKRQQQEVLQRRRKQHDAFLRMREDKRERVLQLLMESSENAKNDYPNRET